MLKFSLKLGFLGALIIAASACSTGGFSAGGFVEFPKRAGPPKTDWADRYFHRASYQTDIAGGQTISYVESGDKAGQRVILIHGSPGHAGDWLQAMAFYVEGLHMIAPDRPGFGYSGPHRALTSLQDQADSLLPLLEERGGKKPILVGWSYGAPVAAKIAADHPDLVGGLVLIAGALDPELEKVRFVQRLGDLPPFRYFVKDSWRIANEELIPLRKELETLAPLLANIQVPVTILHGEQDNLVPIANVDFMLKNLTSVPSPLVTRLAETGHEIPTRHPDLVLNSIMDITGTGCRFSLKASEKGKLQLNGDCPDFDLKPAFKAQPAPESGESQTTK